MAQLEPFIACCARGYWERRARRPSNSAPASANQSDAFELPRLDVMLQPSSLDDAGAAGAGATGAAPPPPAPARAVAAPRR